MHKSALHNLLLQTQRSTTMNPFAASRPVHLSGRVNVQVLRPLLPFATLKSVQSSIATYLERQGRRRQVSRGDGTCQPCPKARCFWYTPRDTSHCYLLQCTCVLLPASERSILMALCRAHQKYRGAEFQSARHLREPTGRHSATITF